MFTPEELKTVKERGISQYKKNKRFIERIKNHKSLDVRFKEEHQKAFEKIDCLQCAGCCKSISPIILQEDIDNMSRSLGMKAGEFIKKYLYMDEDGDFVFNNAPCPFLGNNNYCKLYNARPKACREYPHTDRRKQKEITHLTMQNTKVCPAVVLVIEGLKLHPDFAKELLP